MLLLAMRKYYSPAGACLSILLSICACADAEESKSSPIAISAINPRDLDPYVGKMVKIEGTFSVGGKFGALVRTGHSDFYIVSDPTKSFHWDPKIYGPLEGQRVSAIGILRAYVPSRVLDDTIAQAPKYFYLEVEKALIEKLK